MIKTENKFSRGALWRKWDLHVHTPSSYINNFTDWETFVNKLNKTTIEKDIKVLGITDYFCIDGYKEIISKYRSRLENIELILPNIEFRLDNIVYRRGNRKPRRLNFHVIFSSDVDTKDIETQFLGDIHFKKSSGNAGQMSSIKLDENAIKKYGKECKKQNDFRNDSDLTAGAKNVMFRIVDILKALEEKPEYFKNKYLLFLESEFWADIDWGQDYGLRKNLLEVSHGVFDSNPKDIKWFLGEDTDEYPTIQHFINEFKRLYPCIHGSDAHSENELETRPDKHRYCWIKADPTFMGLKQIINEPKDRVFIGLEPPSAKNKSHIIERIEIKNSNRWFEEKPIFFNENLVSIIGEKGAGKTALADLISLAGGDFPTHAQDQTLFIHKALKTTKQIEETIKNCDVYIHWLDGHYDMVKITDDFSYYEEKKKVRYLSQSFIEKKCSPDNTEELQEEIEKIIFQYIPVECRMGQTSFNDYKKLKTRSIKTKKEACREKIKILNKEVFDIKQEISCLKKKKDEKRNIEEEIRLLEDQKPKTLTEEEEKIETKLTILSERSRVVKNNIAKYRAQLNSIESIKTDIYMLGQNVNEKLETVRVSLEDLELGYLIDKIKLVIQKDFNTIIEQKEKLIEKKIKVLQGKKEEKQEKIKKEEYNNISKLTKEDIVNLPLDKVDDYIAYFERQSTIAEEKRNIIKTTNETIERHKKRLEELEKRIKDIQEVKEPLLPKKIQLREIEYREYFKLLKEEKNVLDEMYAPLKKELENFKLGESKKLEFFSRIEFNVENFCDKGESIIDFGRSGNYFQDQRNFKKKVKSIADEIELNENYNVYDLIMDFYKTFKNSKNMQYRIEEQLKKGKSTLDFYNWIFAVNDYNMNFSIKYQGTNIELLSPGKKGVILLLMYLALDKEGSTPLIIDQPEENLDNKSVYNDLIHFFRIAKKRRQIIVVTHNPNLVLNTDAEQIIVANFEAIPETYQARITYISGAIENSFINEELDIPLFSKGIKEHGADILEGGEVAFKKRKSKWEY